MSGFDLKPQPTMLAPDDDKLMVQKPAAKDPSRRRLSTPKPGPISQAVDSVHTHKLELPMLLDSNGGAGAGMASLTRTHELTPIEQGFMPLVPIRAGEEAKVFDVSFAPKVRGHFETELTFAARFEDGYAEVVRIPVHAEAYNLTDARYGNVVASPGLADEVGITRAPTEEEKKRPATLEFNGGYTDLLHTVGLVFGEARDGVDWVERNEREFKQAAPPTSIWVHLAQIALEVALDQISEHLGHLAGEKLASTLGAALAAKHKTHIKLFEGGVAKAIESSVKETKITELDAWTRRPAVAGVSDIDSVHRVDGDPRFKNTVGTPEADGESDSIPFFEAQKTALHRADASATKQVGSAIIAMAETLGSDSPAVNAALFAASNGAKERLSEVKEMQRNASAVQWMNALTRGKLGVASGPTDPVITTMLTDVRAGAGADGLLEIELGQDQQGTFSITRVGLTGVSDKTAQFLLDMDLRKERIPIAIRLYGGDCTITVDEAGRVRTRGTFAGDPKKLTLLEQADLADGPREEAQGDRLFEKFAARVLSAPLSRQGVTKIETNNAKKE
jgi:hypothetical protein